MENMFIDCKARKPQQRNRKYVLKQMKSLEAKLLFKNSVKIYMKYKNSLDEFNIRMEMTEEKRVKSKRYIDRNYTI